MLDPFAYQHSNPESRSLWTRHWNICLKASAWISPTYADGKACTYLRGLRGAVYLLIATNSEPNQLFEDQEFEMLPWKCYLLQEDWVMYVKSFKLFLLFVLFDFFFF